MKVFDWLQANPDAVGLLVGVLGTWFGAKRVKRIRDAVLAEVDRWAYAAAEAVVKVAEATDSHDAQALAAKGMTFLRALAAGAGITLKPEQEARAQSIIVEALNRLGEQARPAAKEKLGGAARELLRNLERLREVKGGGLEGLK